MKIVGICGYAGAGKDTLAEGIDSMRFGAFGRPYLRVSKASIAKPIKDGVAQLFNIPRELLDNSAFKDSECKLADHPELHGLTWRDVMQRYDDALRQTFGGTVLLKSILAQLKSMQRGGCDIAIVTDVRLPIEIEFLKIEARKLGCSCLVAEVFLDGVGPTNYHRTERALSEELIDLRIENKGGICEFQEAGAQAVLRKLGLP